MHDGWTAGGICSGFLNLRTCSYFYPAVCAVTEIGLCGENAAAQMRANGTGLGSFHTYFMDAVSLMTGEQLQGGQKIEIPTK